ncbi:hypothetical protein CRG98_017599 [Punica granatum]|uniref:Uncharacterized protein n=1 Tax=Punica granatum TaxID=22663 RepID=A0A2I0K1Q0_PUNGR|nr:hypothetical protein CRG98_017599 [Punica granatum]
MGGGGKLLELGADDLECLNYEDLNEPNIVMRRVDEHSGDSEPRESVLALFGRSEWSLVSLDPRLLFVHLNICFGDHFAPWGIVGSSPSVEDRCTGKT